MSGPDATRQNAELASLYAVGGLDAAELRAFEECLETGDAETLAAVHRAHAFAFTWENLDAFMRSLTPSRFSELATAVGALDPALTQETPESCAALVARLAGGPR